MSGVAFAVSRPWWNLQSFARTVLQLAGYDSETGIYFRPLAQFPPIPDRPSHADGIQVLDALLKVVRDFPYATEARRAGWVAATLTPLGLLSRRTDPQLRPI